MNKISRPITLHRARKLSALMTCLVLGGAAVYSMKAQSEDKPFLGAQKPVSGERLQHNRGARDLKVANINDVHGSVQNNSAADVVTGHNTITNGAFSNVSGFPMVVQNTGANVVIQSSTIVNIGLQP